MKEKKLVSFTINIKTLERLNKYSKNNSINKSALIDRLINQEINKNEEKK
jgi:predicted DNA-binding protein